MAAPAAQVFAFPLPQDEPLPLWPLPLRVDRKWFRVCGRAPVFALHSMYRKINVSSL